MVRIAEFKGLNLVTLRLSYNSTDMKLISAPMLPKPCLMTLGMVVYRSIPNSFVINPNSYPKTPSPLYVLAELPNHFLIDRATSFTLD